MFGIGAGLPEILTVGWPQDLNRCVASFPQHDERLIVAGIARIPPRPLLRMATKQLPCKAWYRVQPLSR
jgi:hypothetical protein